MKTALVTGATGFFGRHLVQRLKELSWDVYISNTKFYNLLNYDHLLTFNGTKFSHIFHLAAYTKAGDFCLYHMGDQFEKNQLMNTNILKYWKEHQRQAKMIAIGTSCAYDPGLVKSEENYLQGTPFNDLYTYAMTKRMLLVGLKALAQQYALKYMYYIPSTLYGANFDISDNHFIFDLIKKIYHGKYDHRDVVLWGTGEQKRELTHINDAISLILATLHLENDCLNLACGKEYSIKKYAETICNVLNYDAKKIIYDTGKYSGVLSKCLSVDKIFKILPDYRFVELEKGLEEAILYYSEKVSTNIL